MPSSRRNVSLPSHHAQRLIRGALTHPARRARLSPGGPGSHPAQGAAGEKRRVPRPTLPCSMARSSNCWSCSTAPAVSRPPPRRWARPSPPSGPGSPGCACNWEIRSSCARRRACRTLRASRPYDRNGAQCARRVACTRLGAVGVRPRDHHAQVPHLQDRRQPNNPAVTPFRAGARRGSLHVPRGRAHPCRRGNGVGIGRRRSGGGLHPQLDAGFYQQAVYDQDWICLAHPDHPRIRPGATFGLDGYGREAHAGVG